MKMKTTQGLKYLWQFAEHEPAHIAHIATTLNLSPAVVQTLFNRGFIEESEIKRFLFTPAEMVHDPRQLKDAQRAIERILSAIEKQEKILIAGDYDVDGITSSALLLECLIPLGAAVNFFLPNRVRDGYGLSVKTIERAASNQYKLVITVDNGITAFEPALKARACGIDLIITDHHKPHNELPDAYAIVNPHQQSCTYPFKKFAGVGVSFKLMSLLYEQLERPLPDKVYELLLLGTVADVVPLLEENRYWVRYGLRQLQTAGISAALSQLRDNAGVTKSQLSATDIGFFITPQINALGRLDDPRDGVKFLIGTDMNETARIGKVLGYLNQARKSIEQGVIEDIQRMIAAGTLDVEQDACLIAVNDQWQPGVIGLVAGRLAAQYSRPVILLHKTAQGIAKGSCRSIPALNIFEALQEVKDLLINFGGHAQAAGLSLPLEALPEFKRRLQEYITSRLTPDDFKPRISIDASLLLCEAHQQLTHQLSYLEPFGCENSRPLFLLKNVILAERPQLLKEQHVKCVIADQGVIKPIIFFNQPALYELLLNHEKNTFDIAAHVIENEWRGKISVEFQGLDIALGQPL